MTETMANGYSYKSTQEELCNEYKHDRIWMVFKNIWALLLWMRVASAMEGLRAVCDYIEWVIPKKLETYM